MRPGLIAAAIALCTVSCGGGARTPTAAGPPATTPSTGVAKLRHDAKALAPLVEGAWVKDFLRAADALPAIAPRTVTIEGKEQTLDEEYYYNTKYGTPLAYARPLDVLAAAGVDGVKGRRVFDFGYGGIGHLRLLATLGAQVVGLEVDPLLAALYADPSDTGTIGAGRLALVHGRLAADADATAAVRAGGPYDVIVTKNVLKNGFLHPEPGADPRTVIELGVEEETLLRTFHELLAPGGRFLIYNITPAPNGPGRPYRTWADGRCPWSPAVLEAAGFRVVAHDQDDTAAVRAMAHALGWDQGEDAMNLEDDLYAHYTLLERVQ